jgi:hypothetical protein
LGVGRIPASVHRWFRRLAQTPNVDAIATKNFDPLGAVSALHETSVIFATLIGFFVLKEGNWKRQFGAAVLMAFGIAMIGLNS